MQVFVINLMNELGVNEIVVYGEAFKQTNQHFASWHPFGYNVNFTEIKKINDDEDEDEVIDDYECFYNSKCRFTRLNSEVHALFSKIAMNSGDVVFAEK
eukprot:Pgem_evm1s10496